MESLYRMEVRSSPLVACIPAILTFLQAVADRDLVVKSPLCATERPNILFIFCDDQTNPALSCLGDSRELLETPNIDRLGPQGMKFTRCLEANSICCPSRATILTAKYSHMNSFYSHVAGRPFDGAR